MSEYSAYENNYHFNKGIKSFGTTKVKNILISFYKRYNLPIISIGSGSGSIEHYSELKDYILIDPNPTSFSGIIIIEPHFPYVDNLIEYKPSIIGNCIVFLNWCEPNNNNYDYEAIIKLKPIAICSIYEEYKGGYGAAGSECFFTWTQTNKDYLVIEEHYLTPHDDDMDNMDIRIKIWQNKNLPFENEDIVVTYTKSNISHEGNNCCIQ
jgi:hypothetical protein